MLEQFLNHLDSIGPVRRSDKFLLAVSGGVDSMVMFDLFMRAGISITVAHCNFQLRPGEAEREEELVRTTCANRNVPFFLSRFNTAEFAKSNDLSIQLAARELRYSFFSRIMEEEKTDWLATAHHLDDSLETTLLNLVRGTGLDGLTGIPRINGHTIRPLLFASRNEVETYAAEYGVQFLQDSSNMSDNYSRNLLRNNVIPLLRKINPGLEQTFRSTSARLQQSYRLLERNIQELETQCSTNDGDRIMIEKKFVFESDAPQLMLWEMIKKFGFTYDQCMRMLSTAHSGKKFSSGNFDLINDRTHYILQAKAKRGTDSSMIQSDTSMVTMNNEVLEMEHRRISDVAIVPDRSIAFLDSDKIRYPIAWRYWMEGDVFRPLGMTNHKKLSDFLVDRKIDRLSKEKISVLESGGTIIWVVGQRISEEAKITDKTQHVTVFRWSGYLSPQA